MKKIILFALILLTTNSFSQNLSGSATYEWKFSSADFKQETLSDPKMDPKMKAFIEENMKKMFSKTFTLEFNRFYSIYKEKEDISNSKNIDISNEGINIAIYKDIKEKTITILKEFMGKNFTIKDSLLSNNWKLENETKKIGDYTCFKATLKIPISIVEEENYKKAKKEHEKNPTNFIQVQEPKERIIIAWYTPEISINQGPDIYWGTPGLILEINDDKTTILCSKIIINTKNAKIKISSKGKVLNSKQYQEIIIKKNKELEESDYMPGK